LVIPLVVNRSRLVDDAENVLFPEDQVLCSSGRMFIVAPLEGSWFPRPTG
jgi:hypothetical protein